LVESPQGVLNEQENPFEGIRIATACSGPEIDLRKVPRNRKGEALEGIHIEFATGLPVANG
jgi:hypothetical protein